MILGEDECCLRQWKSPHRESEIHSKIKPRPPQFCGGRGFLFFHSRKKCRVIVWRDCVDRCKCDDKHNDDRNHFQRQHGNGYGNPRCSKILSVSVIFGNFVLADDRADQPCKGEEKGEYKSDNGENIGLILRRRFAKACCNAAVRTDDCLVVNFFSAIFTICAYPVFLRLYNRKKST